MSKSPISTPGADRAVTLKDVAARAGVDKSRASVVLNGSKSSAGVSALVRERILQAAAELDYRPHAVGQALSRRRTNLLGFYSSYGHVNARTPFFADIIGAMQDGCEAHGQELVMHSQGRERSADEIFRFLTGGTIDGLVLFTPPDGPLVSRLAEAHLPVVILADAVPDLPSVVVDDEGGGRLQARHLFERGHKRVYYRRRAVSQSSSNRRFAGFVEEAQKWGLQVQSTIATGGAEEPSAEEKAILLAPPAQRPTALVGWSDYSAYRLLESCLELGLRVPRDFALLGFDGYEMGLYGFPFSLRVSTIRAPWALAARTAIDLLNARLAGHDVPRETLLPVELVAGETT